MLINDQTDAFFDDQLGQASEIFKKRLAQSKRIELPYSLVEAGRATVPPQGDFADLFKLFPTTIYVEVFPPYLRIEVRGLPPKPWPLTVGGLPLQLFTGERAHIFDQCRMGRGPKILSDVDLHRKVDYSEELLERAIMAFEKAHINIREICWFGFFWQVTIPVHTDMKLLPSRIASSPAFYKISAAVPDPDPHPLTLGSKVPQGIEFDDCDYTLLSNALLRPGIM